MNHLERFLANMAYEPAKPIPNWEVGAWPEAIERWVREGAPADLPDWWWGGEPRVHVEPRMQMAPRPGPIPHFGHTTLEEDEQTVTYRDPLGRVRRTMKTGTSMDTYLRFAVNSPADWRELKKRLVASDPLRLPEHWQQKLQDMANERSNPLVLGRLLWGFVWSARQWLGTEGMSYAWYDEPKMMADMMAFWADFLIESTRPLVEIVDFDYAMISEDLAMKTGPLISPDIYRQFILPNLKRVIEHLRSHGVRHVAIDSDGNFELLLEMMLDAGVDAIWPCERAAEMDPRKLRARFGKDLRLWGGIDKRELAKGRDAIDAHLAEFVELIEEGGFIPTVDHTVPPDVSWAHVTHYMLAKQKLLRGELG